CAGIGGVPHGNLQQLLPPLQGAGDVKMKRVVPSAVHAEFLSIQPDFRLPINRIKMQQYGFALPAVRNMECFAVPELFFWRYRLLHTGEYGLGSKRYQDLSIEMLRFCRIPRCDRIIP